jgi:DNA-directed RNA polymerase specialized sigma24 family protein
VYEEFLRLVASGDKEALAAVLVGSEFFALTLQKAINAEMAGRPDDLKMEVAQVVRGNVWNYLRKRGGGRFVDRGPRAFAAYFFKLCARHVRWAVCRAIGKAGKELTGCVDLGTHPEPVHRGAATAQRLVDLQDALERATRDWPDELRQVLADLIEEVPVKETAEKLRLSEDQVKRHRATCRERLRERLGGS